MQTVLAEDPSLVPNTHDGQLTACCNSNSRGTDIFFWPLGAQLSSRCAKPLSCHLSSIKLCSLSLHHLDPRLGETDPEGRGSSGREKQKAKGERERGKRLIHTGTLKGLYCSPVTSSLPTTSRPFYPTLRTHEMQPHCSSLLPGDQGASGAYDVAEGSHRD